MMQGYEFASEAEQSPRRRGPTGGADRHMAGWRASTPSPDELAGDEDLQKL